MQTHTPPRWKCLQSLPRGQDSVDQVGVNVCGHSLSAPDEEQKLETWGARALGKRGAQRERLGDCPPSESAPSHTACGASGEQQNRGPGPWGTVCRAEETPWVGCGAQLWHRLTPNSFPVRLLSPRGKSRIFCFTWTPSLVLMLLQTRLQSLGFFCHFHGGV